MPYASTRGAAQVSAARAILEGLAPDGGLYMPLMPLALGKQESYAALAAGLIRQAFGESFSDEAILGMAQAAYGTGRFDVPEVCPLVPVGGRRVLELFHGPTASFKDLALSLLPRLMASARDQLAPGRDILVLVATSGDTGSATMAGFRDLPGIKVIVFYPLQGVSPVQAAQMQRMEGANLRAVAIRGDFDQAQQGVKAIFLEKERIAPGLLLSSANSINIGRLIPQMVYYAAALNQLGGNEPSVFSVPTGNFGDIFAGLLSRQAGLPIGRLLCATNANRVLRDALESGVYDRRRPLVKTLSPSMDILLSSNFERALYQASADDSAWLAGFMLKLEREGHAALPAPVLAKLREGLFAASCDDEEALACMRQVYERHGYLLDPHTAAAWRAMDAYEASGGRVTQGIVLSTASPFKFPEAALKALGLAVPPEAPAQLHALEQATGITPPRALQGLFDKPLIHQEVIEAADMTNYVKRRASAW